MREEIERSGVYRAEGSDCSMQALCETAWLFVRSTGVFVHDQPQHPCIRYSSLALPRRHPQKGLRARKRDRKESDDAGWNVGTMWPASRIVTNEKSFSGAALTLYVVT